MMCQKISFGTGPPSIARSRRFGARRLKSRDVGFILPLELRGLLRRDCEL